MHSLVITWLDLKAELPLEMTHMVFTMLPHTEPIIDCTILQKAALYYQSWHFQAGYIFWKHTSVLTATV